MARGKIYEGKDLGQACPKCRGRQLIRKNKDNGSLFVGCSEWPDCTYTARLSEDIKMRAMGARGLFDDLGGL